MTAAPATLVALSATHRTAGLDDRAAFAVPPAGVDAFYAAAR